MLSGSMVAVVTPMDADGAVNYRQFAKVIDFHVDSGTQALVVAGTTGESATLDHEEHVEVIAKACELAARTNSDRRRHGLELDGANIEAVARRRSIAGRRRSSS